MKRGEHLNKWLHWIENKLGSSAGSTRKSTTFIWLFLIILLSVALMLFNSFITVKDAQILTDTTSEFQPMSTPVLQNKGGSEDKHPFQAYEEAYQQELVFILQKMVGVGEVEVMVTIESTEEVVVDKNFQNTQRTTTERDTKQASRQISEVTHNGEVVLYQVSGNEQPLVLKQIQPKIRGVIIVANGAENLVVKKMIIEAVERGLDVAPHRISVIPRKQG